MHMRPYLTVPATLCLLSFSALLPFVPAADDPLAPVRVFKGHRENVFSVAFAPDGKLIVTASGDPSIKVWDPSTGKALKTFGEGPTGHKQIILGVAVHPDGSQFASVSADNTLKFWDMPTSNHLREIVLASAPRAVALSPDAARLAAGGTDGKLRLYTTADAKLTGEIDSGASPLTALAFSANGQTLAALSADGTLRYYNPTNNTLLAAYGAHVGAGTGVGFVGNNAALTTGADGTLKTWTVPPVASTAIVSESIPYLDTATDGSSYLFVAGKTIRLGSLTKGELRTTYTADANLTTAAASGPFVVAGSAERDVYLWQAKDTKLVGRIPAHRGPVTAVALNAPGNQLATAGNDGLVRVWTLPLNPSTKIDGGGPVTAMLFSGDGKQVVAASSDNNVRILKSQGGLERQLSGHTAPVRGVALLSDGKTVVSAGDEGTLRLWGTKAETLQLIGAHTGPIVSLVAQGDRVLSASADGSVKLWQLSTAPPSGPLAHPGVVSALALHPDGSRFVTGCDDKLVRLWTLAGDKMERTFAGPTLGILSVALNRAGDRVAAGSADKSLYVWETASGKEVAKFPGLSAAVRAVAFSGDGKLAVAGLADGTVKTFDLASGKEAKPMTAHKGAITALALTPKGDAVVSTGEDGQILMQPLAGGAPVVAKATGSITALALRPDGNELAVAVGKTIQRFRSDGKAESSLETPANIRQLAYRPDGKTLAVAGEDGQARIYGAAGLEEAHPHDAAVTSIAFSADGKRLISTSADKSARIRPTALLWQHRPGAAVVAAQPSPKGDRAAVLAADGQVHLVNWADGQTVAKFAAHKSPKNLNFRPDAAQLVTLGDSEAKLWDLAKTDAPVRSLALGASPVVAEFSPDGKRLAVSITGSKPATNRVPVFDPATGQLLMTFGEAEPLSATALRWAADNRTLNIAGEDRQIRTLDVHVIAAFEAHPGGVISLNYTPAGLLLSSGADKTIRLHSTAGKREKEIAKLPEVPTAVAASFDATLVAATVGKTVLVWNAADGKEMARFEASVALGAVGFNTDKQRLAVAGSDGRARVYDLPSKREIQAFLHTGPVTALTWSRSQANQLFTAGADKQLFLHTLGFVRQVVHEKPLHGLAIAPNGGFVVVASDDGKARRYNTGNSTLERELAVGKKQVTSVSISKNEALIAVASVDAKTALFASNDGKEIATFATPAAARAMTFTADNKALIVALANGSIEAREVAYTPGAAVPETLGQVLQSFTHGAEAHDLALQGKEAIFWTTGGDKSLKAWKLASDSPRTSLSHPNSVNAVAYTPDGKAVITVCSDGKLRTFDTTKGTAGKTIEVSQTKDATSLYGVAVSRDGKRVATAGQDNVSKIFDLESGKLIREIKAWDVKAAPKGHQDSILSVAFSPDGNQLATTGMDQTIKIWNVADGSLVRELVQPAFKTTAHPGWVYSLGWTSDGKHLLSGGAAPGLRGYLAVWEAASGKPLFGKELAIGTIFNVTLSPDEKSILVGTGGTVRSETHHAILYPIPGR
jgi:WD40 repeat protein